MSESESPTAKHRRDALSIILALLCSAVLAVVVGAAAFFWNQLEQTKADNAALASQVRSLGGQPVAEGKPGDRGQAGPAGATGATGPQGPVGPQGPPGVAGKNGVTPPCALLLGGCTGPAGKNGTNGQAGADGVNGADGKDGQPGPPGPAGADGKPGTDGKNGTDGRGIATGPTCNGTGPDSYWVTTYTDGTEQKQEGPCRTGPAVPVPPTN